ncbi:MAG: hypothetical protein K2M07_01470 [Muribaculaceae bacterium]|nr:hypothetical protein [Muribaculaceae bacterium]
METLEKLWLLSAELEGTVLMMRKKGVELNPVARAFLGSKVAQIQDLLSQDDTAMQPAELAVTDVVDKAVCDEQPAEALAEAAEFEEREDAGEPAETCESAEAAVEASADDDIHGDVKADSEAVEEHRSEDEWSRSDPEAEAEDLMSEAEEQETENAAPEPSCAEQGCSVATEEATEPVYAEQQVESPQQTAHSEPEPAAVEETPQPTVAATKPESDQVVRLDEKLARHTSRDIYKAFTINDKFRFRRTLFGNNSSQYNEALDLISQMDGYADTAEYFFNQYGWKPDDENVKAFMEIVRKHFGQ